MSVGLIAGALLLVFGADPLPKGWSIPLVDLDERKDLHREKGQYLGHPTIRGGKSFNCDFPFRREKRFAELANRLLQWIYTGGPTRCGHQWPGAQ